MFIIKLRVLKGNIYFEGVRAIGLASISLYLVKYLLPGGVWHLCVRWLLKWVGYVSVLLSDVYRQERGVKGLTERIGINTHSHSKGASYFSQPDLKILVCILVRGSFCIFLKPF